MPDKDTKILMDISEKIGRIDGTLNEVKKSNALQWVEIKDINNKLTNHRIKTAGLATGTAVGATSFLVGVIEAVKYYFKHGGN